MCVANGEFVAAIFPGTTHKNCDIAAAKVIVEEAGGKVTDFSGGDSFYSGHEVLASNGHIHPQLLEIIAEIQK